MTDVGAEVALICHDRGIYFLDVVGGTHCAESRVMKYIFDLMVSSLGKLRRTQMHEESDLTS